ncbi:MAG: tetratricopeptide repeat protein [Bryobacteraceae bacterium]|nr:tetratricopeptide repeat protein [Solibacteraceae bacterium]MCO5349582.1 tetratricopeptide repeat protein [Bryobacteraceae bacterium]
MPGFRWLLVVCVWAAAGGPALGQSAAGGWLTGRLVSDAPMQFDRFRVEAAATALSRGQPAAAIVSADGGFRMQDWGEGAVELRVINVAGAVVARRLVTARQPGEIEIRIEGAAETPPARAAVSLYRLRHKTPKQALKCWRKAASLAKAGRKDEAERYLREAVRLDPEFADALEQLGVYALARKEYEVARGYLIRAADLDGANGEFQSHAAVAELMSGRPEEAEARARLARRLSPEQGRAKYVLGLALLRQGKRTPEALRNLEEASGEFPGAKAIVAQLRGGRQHP